MTSSLSSGLILPKMLDSSMAFSFSLPSKAAISEPDSSLLSPEIPARENMASTVEGSSPEITLMSRPLSTNTLMVSLQSGLISSLIVMNMIGLRREMRGSPS